MKKSKIYFSVFSVFTLIVLAISPMKDFFSEWKSYQHGYNDIINDLPQRVSPAEIGIKQIWVRKLNRIDRCITCHLGLKEKALTNANQPFTTHPLIYHDYEDFGCTICHDGQGPATTYKESVGKVEYWDKPILPSKFIEASCGKCHKEKVVPDAPVVTLGRKLIEESNCVACHVIPGYDKQWVPSLNGIGSKINKSWLFNWLKEPQAYFPKAKMPNFKLTDEEAYILTDFLMSFKSFPSNTEFEPLPKLLTEKPETQDDELIEFGSTKFKEARCISCHPINGRGGYVATDLGKVASKVNQQWLYSYIKHPKLLQPDVVMPRYRFDDATLTAVVAYMENEFIDFDMEEISFPEKEPDFFKKGQELFEKYNCGGCHELGNFKQNEGTAPELTFIGSKRLYEIDFGKSNIEQTLPSYIFTKVKDPRIFLPSMRMPVFSFENEEIQAITTALLANTDDDIPEEMKVYPKPQSLFSPQGKFGKLVNDLACLGCHKMFGKGRMVATDLSLEGSMAQKNWMENYFKIPYSLRPILTERMPNLFLPDSEIAIFTDYIEKIFITDSLERDINVDDAKIEKGKMLYFEKYACQSCHQINSKGGYLGPPLDNVGSRLKPGWIFYWLKNPQFLVPETIEPNNNMTDEEAEEITAFLLSLKK